MNTLGFTVGNQTNR